MRWLQLQFDFSSTAIRLNSSSTAVRPHDDHSTTYVMNESLSVCGLQHCGLNIQAVRVATQYAPAPLLPRGRPSACAPPSRRNVAVLSHAEYVPTLIAAAALCVKAALSKAAW